VGSALALWALIGILAHYYYGPETISLSAAAMALCLVPTTGTLVLVHRTQHRSPEYRLGVKLLGTLGRMAFVGGVGAVLYKTVPELKTPSFWIWIIVFYLFTLAVEVQLILRLESSLPHAASNN
jgi:hypothetical protein